MSFTLHLELQSANPSRSNWRSNTGGAVGVIQRSVLSQTDSTLLRSLFTKLRHHPRLASSGVRVEIATQ